MSKLMTAIAHVMDRNKDFASDDSRPGNLGATWQWPASFLVRAERKSGPRSDSFRIRSVMWLALVAAVGASFLAHLNLRGAEADPARPRQDSGFALTRGPFELVIPAQGVIQPSEVVDVGS